MWQRQRKPGMRKINESETAHTDHLGNRLAPLCFVLADPANILGGVDRTIAGDRLSQDQGGHELSGGDQHDKCSLSKMILTYVGCAGYPHIEFLLRIKSIMPFKTGNLQDHV